MHVPLWAVAFGIVWNALSVLWTFRVERKFRTIRTELKIQNASVNGVRSDLGEVEAYLERTPTSYFPVAVDLRRKRIQ